MKRIRYSVAMSLDGFIAGPKGEADWITMDPEIDFNSFYSQFDTILIGRRTFTAMGKAGSASIPGMKTIVFSRTLRQKDYPKTTIVANTADAELSKLRAQPGKDMWLFGGGVLFRSLVDAGLVDSVEIAIIPVLLGEGVPLLPPPGNRVKLELAAHRIYKTGIVSLEYALKYPKH